MASVRAIIRVILFLVLTLLLAFSYFLCLIFIYILGSSARTHWRLFIVRVWARSVAAIMGLKIAAHGEPPRPPFFLVSNHLSYLDIVVYFTRVHAIFIAKSEVGRWPFMGQLVKIANTLFIDRELKRDITRVNERIAQNINKFQGLVLFPEGTSSDGATVLTFKPSLLEFPASRQMPVSYASISYRTPAKYPPAHLSVCWWGDMTFGDHLFNMFKLPRIDVTVTFGQQTIQENNRKVLAQKLQEAIKNQFIPVVNRELIQNPM